MKKFLVSVLILLLMTVGGTIGQTIEPIEVTCKRTIHIQIGGYWFDYWECSNGVSTGWDIYPA
jgi:hypothetical protein